MELQGDGFLLRNWRISDAEALQRNADNKNISGFLLDRFPSPYTLVDALAWVKQWKKQKPVINFAIVANDEVIGGIGLEFRTDVYRQTPLLGYWLAEHHWRKGIMAAAVKLVSAYAFKHLEVICIVAYALGNNLASIRVLEKAGFSKAGVIPKSIIKNGKILDEHIYVINVR